MVNENKKERLFEVMGKVNPDFSQNEEKNPCWKGYEQYGMKEKDGKEVPNCVPIDEFVGTQTQQMVPQPQAQQRLAQQQSQPNQQQKMASDVKAMQRAGKSATSVQMASKRINTATEFPQAFKLWFQSLGYKPDNPAITTNRVITDIRKVMQELGYK